MPKIYDKEMFKLRIYEEECERLTQELKYFEAIKRIVSEAK